MGPSDLSYKIYNDLLNFKYHDIDTPWPSQIKIFKDMHRLKYSLVQINKNPKQLICARKFQLSRKFDDTFCSMGFHDTLVLHTKYDISSVTETYMYTECSETGLEKKKQTNKTTYHILEHRLYLI